MYMSQRGKFSDQQSQKLPLQSRTGKQESTVESQRAGRKDGSGNEIQGCREDGSFTQAGTQVEGNAHQSRKEFFLYTDKIIVKFIWKGKGT